MRKVIQKYRDLTYEEKMLIISNFSLLTNFFLAIGKFIFGLFFGFIFCVSGLFNASMFIAKLECVLGIKNNKRTFKKRNTLISISLFISSLLYIIYMGRLLIFDVKTYGYTMFMGLIIAFVSFLEMGIAIYGLFKVKKKGHYYRNIKIINFSSAMTAIVLTQVAILTFTGSNNNFFNGLSGLVVGIVTLLLSIYIYFAPDISIIDREYNEYKLVDEDSNKIISDDEFEIILKKSKTYGNYVYKGVRENNIIKGDIIKKRGFFKDLHIVIQILLIILSEILIFVYAIGRLVYFFKTTKLIEELDDLMKNNGFKKIEEN